MTVDDPFRAHRIDDGILDGFLDHGDRFKMVLRYEDLKAVSRDWRTFSSDAPFRVPIPAEHDVRGVRQLPIESDPPDHTAYRDIVKEPFSRATATAIAPTVRQIADRLLAEAIEAGSMEVVRGFALPLQSRSLALMLGRPQSEAEEWISWGVHVFRDPEGVHASDLDAYLDRVMTEAVRDPGDDYFGLLARATFRGRPLTKDEMTGFANLTFAGGRDTVIGAIAWSLHHLATSSDAVLRLRQEPGLIKTAVEELLRVSSPLTHIGRVVAVPTELCGRAMAADEIASLCFASANHDESAFERADEVVLDRHPNRHVAFGHGPHNCLGAPLARMVLTTVLESFVAVVGTATVVEVEEKVDDLGAVRRVAGFERLVLRLDGHPRGRT